MKRKMYISALLLAGAIMICLAGCGSPAAGKSNPDISSGAGMENGAGSSGKGEDSGSLPDEDSDAGTDADTGDMSGGTNPDLGEADPMEISRNMMQSVTSLEAETVMEMNLKVKAGGQETTLEMLSSIDMSCFSDPVRLRADVTMEIKNLGSVTQHVYVDVSEDGRYVMYLYDGEKWMSQEADISEFRQYDARESLLSYMEEDSQYILEGVESVDGVRAYKYSNTMTGEEMKNAMLSSGIMESLGDYGITADQLESMLGEMGSLTAYVWIHEATLYPVRYEMDMTEAVNAILSGIYGSQGEQGGESAMEVSKMKISMKCHDFNHASDFTVPQEARGNESTL